MPIRCDNRTDRRRALAFGTSALLIVWPSRTYITTTKGGGFPQGTKVFDSDPQLEALGRGANFITEATKAANGSLRDFYKENGYLVMPNALSQKELEELRAEATSICRGERGDVRGFTPGVSGESEEETLRRYLCIHFPNKISETMHSYLGTPKMVEVLEGVLEFSSSSLTH